MLCGAAAFAGVRRVATERLVGNGEVAGDNAAMKVTRDLAD